MNLSKLFKIQKQLDDRILKEKGLEGQDLLDKKILALQVELGELANEWRGFKFWSEDQKPRTREYLTNYTEQDSVLGPGAVWKNPLLEEFVDCLHFILSIGNELEIEDLEVTCDYTEESTTGTFNKLFENVGDLRHSLKNEPAETVNHVYKILFELFTGLGELQLGFTWEQIEQSYLAKNKINHERQGSGY